MDTAMGNWNAPPGTGRVLADLGWMVCKHYERWARQDRRSRPQMTDLVVKRSLNRVRVVS